MSDCLESRERPRLGRHGAVLGILLLGLLSSGGCAATRDHNEYIADAYASFRSGRFDQAAKALAEDKQNELDGLCFIFDTAMVRYVQGEWKASIREFATAKRKMGGYDDRAEVSVRDIAQTSSSFLVNEKTVPYKGEDFERVLLPCFQARNYFMMGDVDGAAVEARRCINQQKLVKKKYEVELAAAKKEARKQKKEAPGASTKSYFSTIQKKCRVPQKYLSGPQNIYTIAFVDYVTAVMLEAQQDFEGARTFYGRAHRILPTSRLIQQDLIAINQRCGYADDAQKFAEQFGLPLIPDGAASLIVLYDSGEAPIKYEESILFPTGDFGFQKFALPYYQAVPNPAGAVRLSAGPVSVQSETLSSIEQIAFRYFNDRLPLITAKAVIRVIAKIVTQKVAGAAGDAAGRSVGGWEGLLISVGSKIGSSLVLSATEQADLRAWRTLPQTLQVARIYMEPGRWPLELSLLSNGGGTIVSKPLGFGSLKPGGLEIINVRSVGTNFWGAGSPGLNLGPDGPPAPAGMEAPGLEGRPVESGGGAGGASSSSDTAPMDSAPADNPPADNPPAPSEDPAGPPPAPDDDMGPPGFPGE